MIRVNSLMASRLSSMKTLDNTLDGELLKIADMGICYNHGVAEVVGLQSNGKAVEIADFPDLTGYECFVNSLNVDDYLNDKLIEYGIIFIQRILGYWRLNIGVPILRSYLIADDDSSVVKFHLLRSGETWLADDLDASINCVLQVDSTDDISAIISSCFDCI